MIAYFALDQFVQEIESTIHNSIEILDDQGNSEIKILKKCLEELEQIFSNESILETFQELENYTTDIEFYRSLLQILSRAEEFFRFHHQTSINVLKKELIEKIVPPLSRLYTNFNKLSPHLNHHLFNDYFENRDSEHNSLENIILALMSCEYRGHDFEEELEEYVLRTFSKGSYNNKLNCPRIYGEVFSKAVESTAKIRGGSEYPFLTFTLKELIKLNEVFTNRPLNKHVVDLARFKFRKSKSKSKITIRMCKNVKI